MKIIVNYSITKKEINHDYLKLKANIYIKKFRI